MANSSLQHPPYQTTALFCCIIRPVILCWVFHCTNLEPPSLCFALTNTELHCRHTHLISSSLLVIIIIINYKLQIIFCIQTGKWKHTARSDTGRMLYVPPTILEKCPTCAQQPLESAAPQEYSCWSWAVAGAGGCSQAKEKEIRLRRLLSSTQGHLLPSY